LILLSGCSGDSTTQPLPDPEFEPLTPVNPQPTGDRLFGITVSESSLGFSSDFAVAQQAGIQTAELALAWDAVETSEGVYQDPDGLLAATSFYAGHGIKVMLTFAVINTSQTTTPAYLDGLDWNDATLMTAFNNMANFVLTTLPDEVQLAGISIGNEVNYILQGDEWTHYGEFLASAMSNIAEFDATLKVGVKTTVHDGLFGNDGNRIKTLNTDTDVVMLNYYHMDGQYQIRPPYLVHNEFNNMVSEFPGRDVWLTEVGFQSGSEHCQSSEDLQASLFHEMFTAWDTYRYSISYVMIDWLHDASEVQIAEWADYYGSSDPAFLEYLGTLGVRTADGEDKNAWIQIKVEANARGWINPAPAFANKTTSRSQ
ncbi:MAG: hypothetical protein GY780_11135, partial [bacterium]|nr:hypothetical protein [bacterium]